MSLADIIFPRICPVCGKIVRKGFGNKAEKTSIPAGFGLEKLICPHCYKRIPFVKAPVCFKCGGHIADENAEYCSGCMRLSRSFERNVALMDYSDPVADRIIWNFKYSNKREFGDFLTLEIARKFGRSIIAWGCEVIIPVPVHPSRKRERGYNQTEVLSNKLGKLLEIKVDTHALKRIKKTLPQKKLDAGMRYQNLKAAFAAEKTAGKYKTVLLVDDIYTTGATLNICTQALKAAGVERVYCVTCCVGRSTR